VGWVLPEVVLQKIIVSGIKGLRNNRAAFDDLFEQYLCEDFANEYGPNYLDQLWTWFSTTKIPVVQSWSFNAQKIPCISIQLANETEDESKAAFSDYFGDGEDAAINVGVFTVMLDIGIHAGKQGDQVLWLYYIVSHILFKNKLMAERLGLKLHTFSASDYNKESKYMAENIWTRWIRYRCTTQNFLDSSEQFIEIEDVNTDVSIGNLPASSIAASMDVNIDDIDNTANNGLWVSRINDPDGDEDELI
jgi:hypothetical protein